MVGGDHLDGLALDLAAVIFDGHLHGDQRALSGGVGIEARHVRQHADLDHVVRDLRPGFSGARGKRRRHADCNQCLPAAHRALLQ